MKIITNQLIQKFREYLIDEEKSKATIEKYIRDLMFFMTWLNGAELNKSAVLSYKHELCKKYAPVSVNSALSSLNRFFSFAGRGDLNVRTLRIQKQIFANKNKELSKYEYEKLLAAAKSKKNKRLYYLMQTICSTGIRVSELKYITTDAVENGYANINCKGKMRVVILPGGLCKILKEYIKVNNIKHGAVFISKNGKPLDRSNIWSDMKKLCEAAGVSKEKVFPHNLRHPYVKLKLKILFNLFCRNIHTEVLNFPYYLNLFIGINKHFINEHIG